jgi:hypothetical protein
MANSLQVVWVKKNTSVNSRQPSFKFLDVRDSQRMEMEDLIGVLLDKKRGRTKFQLADDLRQTPKQIDTVLNLIKTEGLYNLVTSTDSQSGKVVYQLSTQVTRQEEYHAGNRFSENGVIRFGAIANTRIGNSLSRLDTLDAFYRICQRKGIKTVFHCGDILEGVERKATQGEVLLHEADAQVKYFTKAFPLVEGVETYFITAPHHEGSFIDSDRLQIGAYMEAMARKNGRTDLHYLGHREVDVHVKVGGETAIVRLAHVTGNVPYADSYPMQKYIESMQGGTKPHVVLMGHTGKLETILYREVWGVQVGSFIDQTPSMRAGRRSTQVGGQIIELWKPRKEEENFHGTQFALTGEEFNFFNSEFYQQNPEYNRRPA